MARIDTHDKRVFFELLRHEKRPNPEPLSPKRKVDLTIAFRTSLAVFLCASLRLETVEMQKTICQLPKGAVKESLSFNYGMFGVIVLISAALSVFDPLACLAAGSRSGCPNISHDPVPTPVPKPSTIVIPSPSFGTRESNREIDSVVMHTTEVDLTGTLAIFQNRSNSLSAHFVIDSTGEIYEMVDTRDRAWHATYYNSRSIGIEMVGYAGHAGTWNDNNVGALVDLLAWIVTAYPSIPIEHPSGDAYDYPNDLYTGIGLVAHSQVQPWNKQDPGRFFPWTQVLNEVQARVDAVPEPGSISLMLCGLSGLLLRRRRSYQ